MAKTIDLTKVKLGAKPMIYLILAFILLFAAMGIAKWGYQKLRSTATGGQTGSEGIFGGLI